MKTKISQSLIIYSSSIIIAILVNYFFTKHMLSRVGLNGAEFYIIALVLQIVFVYEAIIFFVRGWNTNDKRFLSILYIALALITLFFRNNYYMDGYDLNPLSFITNSMYDNNAVYQILVNIVLFIPFPIVISFYRFQKKFIFISFLISSISVEIIQFLTHRGIFDLGDITLYMIGFFIGWLLLELIKPRLQRSESIHSKAK